MSKKIFVAQSPVSMGRTKSALEGFQLTSVLDFADAQGEVEKCNFGLFLIGVHFDESRGVDLINLIRTIDSHRSTPIILVRLMPTLAKEAVRLIADALKMSGSISEYLEVESDPDAEAKIREIVESHLSMRQ